MKGWVKDFWSYLRNQYSGELLVTNLGDDVQHMMTIVVIGILSGGSLPVMFYGVLAIFVARLAGRLVGAMILVSMGGHSGG